MGNSGQESLKTEEGDLELKSPGGRLRFGDPVEFLFSRGGLLLSSFESAKLS